MDVLPFFAMMAVGARSWEETVRLVVVVVAVIVSAEMYAVFAQG